MEVETFLLRQSYVYDGAPHNIEAPTTMIWHREGETWKVALGHSIPLSPASRAAPRRPAIGGVAPAAVLIVGRRR